MQKLFSVGVGLVALTLSLPASAQQHSDWAASYFKLSSSQSATSAPVVRGQGCCDHVWDSAGGGGSSEPAGCAHVWDERASDEPCGGTTFDGGGYGGCDSCWSSSRESSSCGCDSCGGGGSSGSGRNFYLAGIVGGSFIRGGSGGFNTWGGFPNTNSGNDEILTAGGAIGINIPRKCANLRLEIEGRGRDLFDTRTGMLAPYAPAIFYDVEVEDIWSATANIWFDKPVTNRLDVYAGGGIGMGGFEMQVSDGVVEGEGGGTNFAYQLGAGLAYQTNSNWSVDIGYRYIDLGTGDIGLTPVGVPFVSAGNYTLDVTAHEIIVTLRYNWIGDLFRKKR